MNIWLKEISMDDDKTYYDLLMELTNYKNVYARPVPEEFPYEEFKDYIKARIRLKEGNTKITPTTTYWVMEDETPIGYATLKHKVDPNKVGGHFGLCLKKECQNKGIGLIVSNLLSDIAYHEYKIEDVIYTAKDDNIQSQRSIEKIGGELISIHDGFHFYSVNISKKYQETGKTK